MARLQWLPAELRAVPGLTSASWRRTTRYLVETTYLGATVRKRKDRPTLFYGHVDHPVKTRADWEEYKHRFLPRPDRLPANWETEVAPALQRLGPARRLAAVPVLFRHGLLRHGHGALPERLPRRAGPDARHLRPLHRHGRRHRPAALEHARGGRRGHRRGLCRQERPAVSPRTYREFWVRIRPGCSRSCASSSVPSSASGPPGRFHELLPG